jgi:hypothetical protein
LAISAATRRPTRRIRSRSATEVPPNFMTRREAIRVETPLEERALLATENGFVTCPDDEDEPEP